MVANSGPGLHNAVQYRRRRRRADKAANMTVSGLDTRNVRVRGLVGTVHVSVKCQQRREQKSYE